MSLLSVLTTRSIQSSKHGFYSIQDSYTNLGIWHRSYQKIVPFFLEWQVEAMENTLRNLQKVLVFRQLNQA